MNDQCLLGALVYEFKYHSRKAVGAFREAIALTAQINQKSGSGYDKFCGEASIRKFYYPMPPMGDFKYSAVAKPQDVTDINGFCEVFILDVRKTFEFPRPPLQLTPKLALQEFSRLRRLSYEHYLSAVRIITHVQRCGVEVYKRFWKELGLSIEPELDIESMKPIHGVPPVMAIVHHVGRSESEQAEVSQADMWAVAEELHSTRPIQKRIAAT